MDIGRRSGRIAKEIAILLLATDPNGTVFSEETKTVVLSRHGAGILSRHSLAPEQILTIRTLNPWNEAKIRVIGQIVREPDGYVYGVAFTNPDLDFWQIELPSPPTAPKPAGVMMECHVCRNRHIVEPGEVESDAYTINGSILRPCEICGVTTTWERADPNADPGTAPRRMARPVRSWVSQPTHGTAPFAASNPQSLASSPNVSAAVKAFPDEPAPQPVAGSPAPAPNRRRNKRVGVKFMACVRHPGSSDDVVECHGVSKGGLSFRSRKHYRVNSLIEVAVPYSPGQTPIFVSASIKHVEKPPGSNFYCYGAAWAKAR